MYLPGRGAPATPEYRMTPTYIKTIRTNVKSATGESQTWELSPKTLIVGPNEAGKSAIAQSAQLIAEGGVSGLMLRKGLVKLPAMLMGMAPSDKNMVIEATLSDGSTARWEAAPGKKPTATSKNIGISVEDVRAAFSGMPATARKFLAEAMDGEALTLADLSRAVPPTYADKLEQLTTGMATPLSFTDLLALVGTCGIQRKAANESAKISTAIIQAIGEAGAQDSALVDAAQREYRTAILADFFRSTGRAAKAANDAGDAEPLKAVRWLAAQIGGRDVLASAKPLPEAESVFLGCGLSATVRDSRARAAEAAGAADTWERVEELLTDLFATIVDAKLVSVFEQRVNAYMPKNDRFALDRATLMPGIYRNGRLHTALSGSTEARVLAAMTAALAKPNQLTVLVVDDRMWDGITLSRTLRALEDAPCQVIVMSTMLPRGRRRQTWATIELNARYATDEAAEDAE